MNHHYIVRIVFKRYKDIYFKIHADADTFFSAMPADFLAKPLRIHNRIFAPNTIDFLCWMEKRSGKIDGSESCFFSDIKCRDPLLGVLLNDAP